MTDLLANYLMENDDESMRLDAKTDPEAVRKQAQWCGVKPGLRILDVGCGSGKTAFLLHEMVQPNGEVVGIDLSEERIHYARKKFGIKNQLEFHVHDFTQPINDLGKFDMVWCRFILEYFRNESIDIVNNITSCLKPDGITCLLDLDHNCLNHYPLTTEMETMLQKIIHKLETRFNFDPIAGRKLYAYMFDLKYRNIQMNIMPHGMVYGQLQEKDLYNWMIKMKVASTKAENLFMEYPGGKETFFSDFIRYFKSTRRFSYNCLIIAKGMKPSLTSD